jgi:hypothetical protein
MTKVRAMLAETELPQWLWGEAAYAASYLHNRMPRYYDDNRQRRCGLGKGQISIISEFSVAWRTYSSPGSNGIAGSTRRPFRDIRRLYVYYLPIP